MTTEPRTPNCENWQRRMVAKFRQSGRRHPKCGKPWAEHGEMGECPHTHRHEWRYGPQGATGWGVVTCTTCGETDIYT
jgi:hypothetical protein